MVDKVFQLRNISYTENIIDRLRETLKSKKVLNKHSLYCSIVPTIKLAEDLKITVLKMYNIYLKLCFQYYQYILKDT